ncbi:hypothetical protein QYE76_058621 [Lolium multiflorum]|uniref:Reverse transcriptase domain-containing protein n=1 Tax=Lolium multiflorum TaxID=4521 RepID=A0AAD8WQ28_LOLMU|nr:hypothetical protein QYE76_058621 [Lolium multiflorum]
MTGGDGGALAGDSGRGGSGDAGGAEWAGPPAGEGDVGAERETKRGISITFPTRYRSGGTPCISIGRVTRRLCGPSLGGTSASSPRLFPALRCCRRCPPVGFGRQHILARPVGQASTSTTSPSTSEMADGTPVTYEDLTDELKKKWKGFSPEGALDGVDLSVPSEERTKSLRQEIRCMVTHSLHRHAESLVNTLEHVAFRMIQEVMKYQHPLLGPALGTYQGEVPLQSRPSSSFASVAPEMSISPSCAVDSVEDAYPGRCQPRNSFNINMVELGHHPYEGIDEGSCSHSKDEEEAALCDRPRHRQNVLVMIKIFMAPEDIHKTAFRVPGAVGLFEYVVMTFGLKNAGATYQRAMNYIFHDLIGKLVEIYIDDVVVKSVSTEGHLDDLRRILDRTRKFGLRMNPKKCAFGVTAGQFLGFLVHERGVEIGLKSQEAVRTMQPPTTKKELQRLIGKINFVRRFISNLSGRIEPFMALVKTKSDDEFQANSRAFDEIKRYPTTPPC